MDIIPSLIKKIDPANLSADLFYLAKDPLPSRTLNYTLPGHAKSTLHEADDYIQEKFESRGYPVERETVPVQAFRLDESKPKGGQRPEASDPWYDAYNIYAKKTGASLPEEVVLVIAHKDSQSWLTCCAGAYDNAVGTVAAMEMARVLRDYDSKRSIWFMFCNEEHRPWTSATAARNLAASPLSVIAVINVDSLGGRSAEDQRAGRMINITRYTNAEGEKLADLMAHLNEKYGIGLIQSKHRREGPGDDDGSFVSAGIPAAVMNIGSCPYVGPGYHTVDDIPENVDLVNLRMGAQLSLAGVVHLDIHGL